MNKTKFKNQKIILGSVLVFALITLGITVALALGIVQVAVMDKKISLSTEKSNSAFQQADSGAEMIVKEYLEKKSGDYISGAAFSGCDSSDGKIKTAGQEITLKASNGNQIDCDSTNEQIKDIALIQATGSRAQQNRTIDFTPPCPGFNSQDSSSMAGWWIFKDPTDPYKDSSGSSNADRRAVGSANNPIFDPDYNGYPAIVLNTGSFTPDNRNYNYLEIGDSSYGSSDGAVSFWFYSNNTSGDAWVPFSKSGLGCDSRGSRETRTGPGYGASTSAYIDVNSNRIKDSGDITSPSSEVNRCYSSVASSDPICDCGYLTIGENGWGRIVGFSSTRTKFVARLKNDGNWGGYTLGNDAIFEGAWHMVTVAYNSSAYKMYIDGKLVYTYSGNVANFNNRADTDGMESLINNKRPIFLGVDNGTNSKGYSYFKGAIRDLRIYTNTALKDPACVKKLYNDTK